MYFTLHIRPLLFILPKTHCYRYCPKFIAINIVIGIFIADFALSHRPCGWDRFASDLALSHRPYGWDRFTSD